MLGSGSGSSYSCYIIKSSYHEELSFLSSYSHCMYEIGSIKNVALCSMLHTLHLRSTRMKPAWQHNLQLGVITVSSKMHYSWLMMVFIGICFCLGVMLYL